jgi:hypothetical protein
MRLASYIGMAGCVLVVAACGHQGTSESQVRTQVRGFVGGIDANIQRVDVRSCAREARANEWRCRVRVLMPDPDAPRNPTAHRRFSLIVRTSCGGKRCHLSRSNVTTYTPSNAAWKAVINDWFHGGIDHPHTCAAVKAAIAQLPMDGGFFGAARARSELQGYARTVC